MLSEKAFNAFLKTLEEPPPHAKFVFATTEIRKVPVTILSRCQRFDLRRGRGADPACASREGLRGRGRLRRGRGSRRHRPRRGRLRARRALAPRPGIAHGAGTITAQSVRDMLGLADRARILDLFEAVMRGSVPAAFAELRAQYDSGADPSVVLSDLAAFTHLVTGSRWFRRRPPTPRSARRSASAGAEFAEKLSIRALSRAWQILLKAIPEVQAAPRPLAAAEMAIVRLAYAADLPTPDEALRQLKAEAAAAPAHEPLPCRRGRRCRRSPTCVAAAPRRWPPHPGRRRRSRRL